MRAFVVDDEADMRLLVRVQLETRASEIEVVGEASDGPEAVDRCRSLQPDVIVLDNRMPTMTGIEAAAAILAERGDTRIVMYTAHLDPEVETSARHLGIACVDKGDVQGLVDAVVAG